MYHIPEVSVSVNGKEQIMSVLSRDLMSKRTIYLNGEINDEAALSIITQLHYLEDNSQEPITLVINSPGGSVSAGLAIYDVMQALSCPVTTAAVGLAASMAALVLAAGTMGAVLLTAGAAGKRSALPHSRVMIHQPLGMAQGQATDIQIAAENIQRTKYKLAERLAAHSGHTVQDIQQDCERDSWMDSSEALRYGLIDHIGFPCKEEQEAAI